MSVSQQGPAVLRPALKKLAQLQALEHDWDGYGGLPPSDRSLAMARSVMLQMVSRFGELRIAEATVAWATPLVPLPGT